MQGFRKLGKLYCTWRPRFPLFFALWLHARSWLFLGDCVNGENGKSNVVPVHYPTVESSLGRKKQTIWKCNLPALEYVLLYIGWFQTGMVIFQHLLFVKNYCKMAYVKGMESYPWLWPSPWSFVSLKVMWLMELRAEIFHVCFTPLHFTDYTTSWRKC